MTKIKLCGMTCPEDIQTANLLMPDYIGFVLSPVSRRYISSSQATALKKLLSPQIAAVGVFVREEVETVAELLNRGVLDAAQLHGGEDALYLARLRALTDRPILQAFRIHGPEALDAALRSPADMILLDSGAGSGKRFNWDLLRTFPRPYFLAGGLTPENAADAISALHPYALDVSSGIETDGKKDPAKMKAFVETIRNMKG